MVTTIPFYDLRDIKYFADVIKKKLYLATLP